MFRSVRDPKSLTARQRSLMNDGLEVEDLYQALDFGRLQAIYSSALYILYITVQYNTVQ